MARRAALACETHEVLCAKNAVGGFFGRSHASQQADVPYCMPLDLRDPLAGETGNTVWDRAQGPLHIAEIRERPTSFTMTSRINPNTESPLEAARS